MDSRGLCQPKGPRKREEKSKEERATMLGYSTPREWRDKKRKRGAEPLGLTTNRRR